MSERMCPHEVCSECRATALRYIDGWITSKLVQNLKPEARAILGDMRIHIEAALERMAHGDQMEATTQIMDTKCICHPKRGPGHAVDCPSNEHRDTTLHYPSFGEKPESK